LKILEDIECKSEWGSHFLDGILITEHNYRLIHVRISKAIQDMEAVMLSHGISLEKLKQEGESDAKRRKI